MKIELTYRVPRACSTDIYFMYHHYQIVKNDGKKGGGGAWKIRDTGLPLRGINPLWENEGSESCGEHFCSL